MEEYAVSMKYDNGQWGNISRWSTDDKFIYEMYNNCVARNPSVSYRYLRRVATEYIEEESIGK